MEFRNPVYNEYGGIDVEVNHPRFGWIPYTANSTDTRPAGRALHDAIVEAGNIAPFPGVPTEEASRRQRQAQRKADRDAIMADDQVANLIKASPQQIEARINSGVTDLASAKQIMIRLAKAISVIGREAFEK